VQNATANTFFREQRDLVDEFTDIMILK